MAAATGKEGLLLSKSTIELCGKLPLSPRIPNNGVLLLKVLFVIKRRLAFSLNPDAIVPLATDKDQNEQEVTQTDEQLSER